MHVDRYWYEIVRRLEGKFDKYKDFGCLCVAKSVKYVEEHKDEKLWIVIVSYEDAPAIGPAHVIVVNEEPYESGEFISYGDKRIACDSNEKLGIVTDYVVKEYLDPGMFTG